ncbi:hypothetical protein ACF1HJ_41585 [Streptomyces sp. NPDC013978]|uniref:hypothetical protein n=1 Tax=Streptomyces sp. NPDC013978 TaxID=3364869 RepID=UPI0036FD419A
MTPGTPTASPCPTPCQPTALSRPGDNSVGQLGNGSTTDSGTPVTVRTGIGTITRIAAGGDFNLAA